MALRVPQPRPGEMDTEAGRLAYLVRIRRGERRSHVSLAVRVQPPMPVKTGPDELEIAQRCIKRMDAALRIIERALIARLSLAGEDDVTSDGLIAVIRSARKKS